MWKRTWEWEECRSIFRWRWSNGSTICGWRKNARTKRKPSVVFPVSFREREILDIAKRKKKIRKNLKMKKISNERTNSSFSRYTYLFHGICIIFAWMLLPLPLFLLIHVNRVSRFIPSDLFFFLFVILFHLASKVFLLDFFYSVQTSKYIRNKEM